MFLCPCPFNPNLVWWRQFSLIMWLRPPLSLRMVSGYLHCIIIIIVVVVVVVIGIVIVEHFEAGTAINCLSFPNNNNPCCHWSLNYLFKSIRQDHCPSLFIPPRCLCLDPSWTLRAKLNWSYGWRPRHPSTCRLLLLATSVCPKETTMVRVFG
jgi:hypothetical protein